MPESKEIKFDTKYKALTINNANTYNLSVEIAPESVTPNTLEGMVNFSAISAFINNREIVPANLTMIMKNHLADIDFHIDRNGHLIVNAEDAENYSLDANGHLIYTYR